MPAERAGRRAGMEILCSERSIVGIRASSRARSDQGESATRSRFSFVGRIFFGKPVPIFFPQNAQILVPAKCSDFGIDHTEKYRLTWSRAVS
jgi:hypothetical protein